MYQGRLWLFRGYRNRGIIVISIFVLIFTNTILYGEENNKNIKLDNIKVDIEELKNIFNPAVKKFKDSKIKKIIIDPGHGGKDPGSIGVDKIKEKDVVLSFAIELRDELKKVLPDKEIVLTRDGDTYPTLEERYKDANKNANIDKEKSDNAIFISIHANASLNSKAKGFEVYFLTSQESSEYARSVSLFENETIVKFSGINPYKYKESSSQITHNYMLVEEYQRESRLLAEEIVKEAYKVDGVYHRSKPVVNALFYVLKGALMPAVLVELGFITNPDDAKFLTTKDTRIKLVKSMAKAIKSYTEKIDTKLLN